MVVKKSESREVQIVQVAKGQVDFCILGTSPIVLNRMSEKARRELLLPRKKTAADRAQSLKHNPYDEFKASPYINHDEKGPTYLQHLASAFKGAVAAAALDVPGSSKAQIGRLCWVEGERVDLYGIPELFMAIVRSADMNKTPDVRTRAIVPKWACRISISFSKPILNETAITNLLAFAGFSQGTGDGRNGKGKLTYGSFEIVSADNADYLHLLKHCGRKPQMAAMDEPKFYDAETEELYEWFQEEIKRRGREDEVRPTGAKNGKAKRREVLASV